MTSSSSKDKPPELHDAFARLTLEQWVEAMRLGRGSVGLGICIALDSSIDQREQTKGTEYGQAADNH